MPKKVASLDPGVEISCANKAPLISGLKRHHSLADLLQIAGLAPSTFYYQCQAIVLYLSACMDLYSREIIAYRIAWRPVLEMVSDTLGAALSKSEHVGDRTVHSDQGWLNKIPPYRMMLACCGVTQSISRKGNCFDNAVIESFFGTLKADFFHLPKIEGIEALEAGVNDHVADYNNEPINLGLQGLSPVNYRLKSSA